MKTCSVSVSGTAEVTGLQTGAFLVLLHATRIPPHIGMLFNGRYHSLTVKGRDLDVTVEALLKNVTLRKLPSLFIELLPPAAFTIENLSLRFRDHVNMFERVEAGVATCLSPIKLFIENSWQIDTSKIDYVYQLVPLLAEKSMLGRINGCFLGEALEEGIYRFPWYTMKNIYEGIHQVRAQYK
jgi:hypothetical protein